MEQKQQDVLTCLILSGGLTLFFVLVIIEPIALKYFKFQIGWLVYVLVFIFLFSTSFSALVSTRAMHNLAYNKE